MRLGHTRRLTSLRCLPGDTLDPLLSTECPEKILIRLQTDLSLRLVHIQSYRKCYAPVHSIHDTDTPASILYKSIAGRYRPVSYPDGPTTARYRFIKNAYWVLLLCSPTNNYGDTQERPQSRSTIRSKRRKMVE